MAVQQSHVNFCHVVGLHAALDVGCALAVVGTSVVVEAGGVVVVVGQGGALQVLYSM